MRLWMRSFVCLFVLLSAGRNARAQEVQGAPGHFDYYLLNLSWAPEFCHNIEVLPQNERTAAKRSDAALECGTPHGFVLHGLWPQNTDGTWPAHCSDAPGPADYAPYLRMTPSETLLRHEWSKHGTCTTMQADRFFTTAKRAFDSVRIPQELQHVDHTMQMEPQAIVAAFLRANPSSPQGSVVLSCGRNYLTAINVCLSKDRLAPVACQNVHECGATVVKVAPER